jgi:hypothetical protein
MNAHSAIYVRVGVVTLFVCVSLGFLAYIFSVLIKADTFSREAQGRIAVAERQFAQSRSFVRVHTETALAREQLKQVFVEEEDIALFIEEIEELARTAGIALEVGSVELGTGVWSDLSLTVRFSGNFSSTYRFLALLETVPYSSSIETVSFQKNTEGTTWEGTARVVVTARNTK